MNILEMYRINEFYNFNHNCVRLSECFIREKSVENLANWTSLFSSPDVMDPIRVLSPSWGDLMPIDAVSKLPIEPYLTLLKETNFYIFHDFNATIMNLKLSLSEVAQTDALIPIQRIQQGKADVYFVVFGPTSVPINITTGPVAGHQSCFIYTFPTLKPWIDDNSALEFVLSEAGLLLIASMIMLLIIAKTFTETERGSFSVNVWNFLGSFFGQIDIATSFTILQIIWSIALVALFLVQSITTALINTERVAVVRFDRVETVNDIYSRRMIVTIEDYSGCLPIIKVQKPLLRRYLEYNRLPKKNAGNKAIDQVFKDSFVNHPIRRMAFVLPVLRWRFIQRQNCIIRPHLLHSNPVYSSRQPVDTRLHIVLTNSKFKYRRKLFRQASTATENGLWAQRGFYSTKWAGEPEDQDCLKSKPNNRREGLKPLNSIFFHHLMLLWLIVTIFSIIIFALEFIGARFDSLHN